MGFELLKECLRLVVQQVCGKKFNVDDIFGGGFPTLPACIFRLDPLLNASPVDLKAVTRIVRKDRELAAQLVNICNSVVCGLEQNVSAVEEAVLLLGPDRLKALILICHLMEYTRHGLAPRLVNAFWRHCFLVALLSRQIACWIAYPEPEEPYLAGLLHDIGVLPLFVFAVREQLKATTLLANGSKESLDAERQTFGVDHCEVGRLLGESWKFPPALIAVIEHHHCPENAPREKKLVGIVAASDRFCEMHGVALGATSPRLNAGLRMKSVELLEACLPGLSAAHRDELAAELELAFRNVMRQHSLNPWAPLDN